MDVGLLVLRVLVGGAFAAHGTQKLFGWFGGHGLEGTGGFFSSIRMRAPKASAFLAGATELGAGLLLVAGFLTPLAAAGVIGVMTVAIVTVKLSSGFFNGYEVDTLYAVPAAALAFTGAGAYSVDGALDWNFNGIGWGVTALALGVGFALVVLASRRPVAPAIPEAEHVPMRRAA